MIDWIAFNAAALLVALVLDAMFGEPNWLWKRLPHPVVLIGKLIGRMDERLNRDGETDADRRQKGVAALAQLLLITGVPVALFWWGALWLHPVLGFLVSALVGAILLAQRSLYDHVAAVRDPLNAGHVDGARQALSMIVGRKTESLDESGITRAALESLAENHSDGVIAPAFWMLIGGPIGIVLYKAINTADSMIGYKTPRHLHFGRASAKLDDAVNFLPARLSVLLIMVAVATIGLTKSDRFAWPSWRVIVKDAPTHASPNAGWPEASYASALRIALGGPRVYPGQSVDAPYINAGGRKDLSAHDISAGLALFRATCMVTGLVVVGVLVLSALWQ